MQKRSKRPLWRGKQANRPIPYVLTTALQRAGSVEGVPLTPGCVEAFCAGFGGARKNTQAMPPTAGNTGKLCAVCGQPGTLAEHVAGLVHTPDPEQSLVPAEPAPEALWTVPQTRSSTLPPVAELSEVVMLHLRGSGGHTTARALREAVPARLAAWVDDALRRLRDMGQLQCLTLGGEHVWRMR